jgi:hypothetical protein
MSNSVEQIAGDGAACTLFRDAPVWDDGRTAAIGSFSCASAAAGAALLAHIGDTVGREGYDRLIGPMDGDTWHRYRVVTESDGSPPFPLEPVSGPHDLAAFTAAGFVPISSYVSARATLDDAIGAGAPVEMPGLRVEAWDGRDPHGLIGRLFDLSSAGFDRNAFFKPILKAEFLKLYEPIIPLIDPRHVLFAHEGTTLLGFLFGYPNRAEGAHPTTIVLKTYASGRRGVGHLLADVFHRTARTLGFTDVIHALMHVDNASRRSSEMHHATTFRRYALMGRRLSS